MEETEGKTRSANRTGIESSESAKRDLVVESDAIFMALIESLDQSKASEKQVREDKHGLKEELAESKKTIGLLTEELAAERREFEKFRKKTDHHNRENFQGYTTNQYQLNKSENIRLQKTRTNNSLKGELERIGRLLSKETREKEKETREKEKAIQGVRDRDKILLQFGVKSTSDYVLPEHRSDSPSDSPSPGLESEKQTVAFQNKDLSKAPDDLTKETQEKNIGVQSTPRRDKNLPTIESKANVPCVAPGNANKSLHSPPGSTSGCGFWVKRSITGVTMLLLSALLLFIGYAYFANELDTSHIAEDNYTPTIMPSPELKSGGLEGTELGHDEEFWVDEF